MPLLFPRPEYVPGILRSSSLALLATLFSLLAGCSGSNTGDDDASSPVSSPTPFPNPDATPTPRPSPTPTPNPTPTPIPTSHLLLSSTELEFGTVPAGTDRAQVLAVSNTGATPLLLTVTLPVNPSSQYAVTASSGSIPDELAPSSTLLLSVTFTPTVLGDAAGKLRIDTSDAVQSRVDVSLNATGGPGEVVEDEDNDGYSIDEGDCNDANPAIYPDAKEICDGIDNDCDAQIDEEGKSTFYVDQDGDGYGAPGTGFQGCSPGEGASSNDDDCNDASSAIHPGATEVCDGVDNDCNGTLDDGQQAVSYLDRDQDGYGDSTTTAKGCTPPEGYVLLSGDCADDDASVYPGAEEVCNGKDDDCDGEIDKNVELTWYRDADGDSYGNPADFVSSCQAPSGYVSNSRDCNDKDASSYPGAQEVCDTKDNDCDGSVDENVQHTYFKDADGDGKGDPDVTFQACSAPLGYVTNAQDCNDGDADIYLSAPEICDSKDNDCDGQIDEEGTTTYYLDYDGDGHGDPAVTIKSCNNPQGYASVGDDCNDRDKTVYPGATETCNSKDDNCNGSIDEGVKTIFYLDADKDGYGDDASTVVGCSAPANYITKGGDCNDLDKSSYPGALEVCDSHDNDCDGKTDEDVLLIFYADADKDGYGDVNTPSYGCTAPKGTVDDPGAPDGFDCDDTRNTVHPDAPEVCDNLDNDCNGQIDEGVKTTYYLDTDKDGYGSTSSVQACAAPSGYVSRSGDCNDSSATTFPGANELCDGQDNNCDSQIDEGVKSTFYADVDADTYGDPNSSSQACSAGNGLVANKLDCNDADATVHPGAAELCDKKDNDCDLSIDEPGDSVQTVYYKDQDGDGYGVIGQTTYACSTPTGYAANSGDCLDTDGTTYPGALELCKGVDNNCDGMASPPSAPLAGSNSPLCYGSTLNLSASTISKATYGWTGPKSFSSSLQNPSVSSVTGANAGTYSVTATVDGCTSNPNTLVVTINDPTSTFSSSPASAVIAQSVTFTPTVSGATSYAWTFQGGSPSTSTLESPTVTWSSKGTYNVSLTVTQTGCAGSTTTAQFVVAESYKNCQAIKQANPSAADGVYAIDPDGFNTGNPPFNAYCDMTSDGGGWTLVYRDSHDGVMTYNVTTDIGTVANLQSVSGASAKYADATINALRSTTTAAIAYRMTSSNISNKYYAPGQCTYQHNSNNNSFNVSECMRYTASYTTSSSPTYIQCISWGGNGAGLDMWYQCGGSGGYSNVVCTHKSYTEIGGITTNASGALLGSSNTTYGNSLLVWVK